ncbi:MAG: hypothetical protein AAF823_07535 [Planctomycetota bacterium]
MTAQNTSQRTTGIDIKTAIAVISAIIAILSLSINTWFLTRSENQKLDQLRLAILAEFDARFDELEQTDQFSVRRVESLIDIAEIVSTHFNDSRSLLQILTWLNLETDSSILSGMDRLQWHRTMVSICDILAKQDISSDILENDGAPERATSILLIPIDPAVSWSATDASFESYFKFISNEEFKFEAVPFRVLPSNYRAGVPSHKLDNTILRISRQDGGSFNSDIAGFIFADFVSEYGPRVGWWARSSSPVGGHIADFATRETRIDQINDLP